jgi:Holliday junction DNA helicase RuvA
MISSLRGTIGKEDPGHITVDVAGVGYGALVPITTWDDLEEGALTTLYVSTYVREDRFELYAFLDKITKQLFEALIQLSGVGPKMGLELCAVPKSLLLQSVNEEDPGILTAIKGVGRKTAEKLLIELKSLTEKNPHMFAITEGSTQEYSRYDRDAIAALSQLGFANGDIMRALENLPADLQSTEERVTAALRSL